jgi:hypothetical protein
MLWRTRESAVEKWRIAVENWRSTVENGRSTVEKWHAAVENAVEILREKNAVLWMTCGRRHRAPGSRSL